MKENQVFIEEFERQLTIKIADPTYGKDTFRMRASLVEDFVGDVTATCKFKVYKESHTYKELGKMSFYTIKMSCGKNRFTYESGWHQDTDELYQKSIKEAVEDMDTCLSVSPSFNYKWCNELIWNNDDYDMPDTWNEWYQDYLYNLV